MEGIKPKFKKQTALILTAILLAFSLFSAFLYFNTSPDPNYPSASKPKSNNSQDGASSSTPVPSSSKAASHQDPGSTRSKTNNNTKTKTNTNTNTNTDLSTTRAFTFVAQPGDSYTLFARQAIASFLAQNQIFATDQQKLIAEINLTNSAGAPYLEIGDQISIQSSDIAKQFPSATATGTAPTSTVASDGRSASDVTSQTKSAHSSSKTSSKSDQPGSYTFTAQPGDSYTLFARQAIQQSKSGAKLSPAQKVAAETKLAAAANWPAVNLGQTVKIDATDLKQAIDFAIKLSPAELSAWQPFADLIVW